MPKVRINLPLAVIVSALVGLSRPSSAQDAGDAGGIFLPGTQPRELTMDLRSPALCDSCHGGYADYAANDTWQGTMMANAARDPLFHAALTVANQDRPGSGKLARRHSPRGWLFGRSSPPLISNLTPDDFESVQCDFCHRLTKGPTGTPHIGNAQYFVADDFVRRRPDPGSTRAARMESTRPTTRRASSAVSVTTCRIRSRMASPSSARTPNGRRAISQRRGRPARAVTCRVSAAKAAVLLACRTATCIVTSLQVETIGCRW